MTLAGLLQSETPWLAVLGLVFAFLLLHARPQDRVIFLNTLSLFLLCLIGQGLAVVVDLLHSGLASALYLICRIGAAITFIRLAGFTFFRLVMPLAGKSPPRIIEDLAIIAAYVVYGLAQLRLAGLDLSSLVTTSAILTAVLAFAMQDTLGNVLGGLAIQLDNTVQVGDWVRVDNLVGRVRDIRWRSTLIETRDWETVVVPNSALMKGRVAILGRREGAPLLWRRQLDFMVDPGVPPARVIATLDEEMQEVAIPNVARTPLPSTVMTGFEHGNITYRLRYFLVDFLEDDLTDSRVRMHLFASLQRAGIRIAERQHTVHAVTRDQAHADTVRKRELTRRLEMLRGVDLLAPLAEAEMTEIAERLEYAPFARGDIITKQGGPANWLYIVAFGEAEVQYEGDDGPPQHVGILRPGEFFGEMALLTGDARAATVIARTDVECYRLDRASFQALLLRRPELADQVGQVMGSRRGDLERARETAAAVARAVPTQQPDLVSRIRRFFGVRG